MPHGRSIVPVKVFKDDNSSEFYMMIGSYIDEFGSEKTFLRGLPPQLTGSGDLVSRFRRSEG